MREACREGRVETAVLACPTLPEKLMSDPKYLTDDEFRQRLREAGFSEEQIEEEMARIDDAVEEAGYDGP